MPRAIFIGLITLTLGFAAGCSAPPPPLTQAQITAIETREVDANLADTYNAASSALFDAGYIIIMSDRQGGLITGRKGLDKSSERAWLSPTIRDDEFMVSIQMREAGPTRTTTRIKTAFNGEQRIDKTAIDQLWVLMQRQVMMSQPPTLTPPPRAGSAK